MPISYATEQDVAAAEVAAVFHSAGLRRPVNDLARIERMLRHANLTICARDEGRLVGVARSLTDFCYCCYLSDLAVDGGYQRQGIGRELIRRTQEAIGPQTMLLLLSAPTAHDYYPHIGFKKVDNGWMIERLL